MEELMCILREHAARYPRMEATDALKLIYQNEFGGGHLIRDEDACLQYLHREFDSVAHDPQAQLYEEIGNGIVRIHLAALQEEDLPWLGESFIASAETHQGEMNSFLEKLAVLRKLTDEGFFGFNSTVLEEYLTQYRQAGYPAVSHSRQYREAYHPAYRIICRKFLAER